MVTTIIAVTIFFSVMPGKQHMCQTMDAIELDPSGGYIGKQTLEGSGAYLSDCIWSLQVQQGQRISFTFFSFLYGRRQNYKQFNGESHSNNCGVQMLLF